MLSTCKFPRGVKLALLLILVSGTGYANPGGDNIVCDQIAESFVTRTGLYTTDGAPGYTAAAFVRYTTLPDGQTHLCEIGVRFADPDRVFHCLPTGVCPRGEQLNIDLPTIVNDVKDFPFKSVGVSSTLNGHEGGNFEEFREFWDLCEAAGVAVCGWRDVSHDHLLMHCGLVVFGCRLVSVPRGQLVALLRLAG